MSRKSRTMTALAVLGLAVAAYASVPKVEVTVQAQKEVVKTDPSGKRAVELKPADEAATGDTIIYTLQAKNTGTGPAMSPKIEDPIPAGTVLVLDSVAKNGYAIEASLDAGETYTTLRWVLNGPLQPGDGKDVSFKVRIR